jgi:hypothetical protein
MLYFPRNTISEVHTVQKIKNGLCQTIFLKRKSLIEAPEIASWDLAIIILLDVRLMFYCYFM